MALLAVVALPLAGCDSTGSNGGSNGDDGSDGSTSLSAPSNVTATAQSDGTVDLSWDGVSAAAEYNVYRSTSPINDASGSAYSAGIASTSYTDSDKNTSDGTTYYYYVTGVSDDGVESSLSSSEKVTVASTPSGGGREREWEQRQLDTGEDGD
jgi:fibronectin type 3 domain-containing protein